MIAVADQKTRIVRCPTCGKSLEWSPDYPHRPFCSERCRKIDLGAWANEEYRVPVSEDRLDPEAE
ncbi:DNA gyrase inhibitor YacG [Denitratisoma oestradiolicum]|uniref:DNA gyrase inhibitor YacG n=1 Tax=Denitratisoma oestradiolicum TaxID=311182 RepID=A0A6S6XXY5_9PROT|nr:DNA gyrase inhibitor YacG [Denitratisoma oestradiolicum]